MILLAPLASLAILGAAAVEIHHRPQPQDALPFHQRIRALMADIPMRIGDWTGVNKDVPREAQALLQPNAMLSRGYRNLVTGQSVDVIIVQTRDARDMVGHYPPVCYRNLGWKLEPLPTSNPRRLDITLADTSLPLVLYQFSLQRSSGDETQWIYNFMILPGTGFFPDMDSVEHAEADYTKRFFGASQVQIIFRDPRMTDAERQDIARTFLNALKHVILAIRSGAAS